MNRYVCIHGHFYQPPRENAWLETIEVQDSAHPYRDWNERVTAECYAPNSASRILDAEKHIINIVNNYSKISFNFGPTLLSWMKETQTDVYEAILAADKESQKNFSGHGSAIAQVYNHMIMPLANRRDKETQIIWGIKDFESHFKRSPEGMWLAETAVDTETLELLAQYNIKFTILAPRQALRIRRLKTEEWTDVKHGRVDPKMPYLCRLPSGKSIVLFFYDGPIAQDLAFGGLLNNGEAFANRMVGVFPKDKDDKGIPLLAHVATDGESYGHHHFLGDMALAYCLHNLETKSLAKITIYGEFLENFPPVYEVEIIEDSSWSCIHGVERWRSDCGCNSGGQSQWNQKWRAPLRRALDWLRDELAPLYAKGIGQFFDDPWAARNAYIKVILNRTDQNISEFLSLSRRNDISSDEEVTILKLLELQRHSLLMYTSCGWFFDEISGIETVQIIQYAARSIQLARDLFKIDLEEPFLERLSQAPSNIAEIKNGAGVFEKFVRPAIIDLFRVSMHYSMTSLFQRYPNPTRIYSYIVDNTEHRIYENTEQKLAVGSGYIQSVLTKEKRRLSVAVFHQGSHNLSGAVRDFISEERFKEMEESLKEAFNKSDTAAVIALMQKEFDHHYTLADLFRSEQEYVLNQVLDLTMKGIEKAFREIYEKNAEIIQAQKGKYASLPKALATIVEYVINRELIKELKKEEINLDYLNRLVAEVKRWNFGLDSATLGFLATKRIDQLMQEIYKQPDNISLMEIMDALIQCLGGLSLKLDIWRSQNLYFLLGHKYLNLRVQKSALGDPVAATWVKHYTELGSYLSIKGH